MANKHRGEVEVMLDKKRILCFGTHALAELEDQLGYSLVDPTEEERKQIERESKRIKTIVHMVRAGLLHEEPNLTFKETADLMDCADYEYIGEKLAEALELLKNRHIKEVEKKTSEDQNIVGGTT